LTKKELLIKRDELINIYNNSLYAALKASNKKKMKEVKEKYMPERIDIFQQM
jgi:hypothetical protein